MIFSSTQTSEVPGFGMARRIGLFPRKISSSVSFASAEAPAT
jgi:hypothetical protein